MNYCQQCGAELRGRRFCVECGAPVEADAAPDAGPAAEPHAGRAPDAGPAAVPHAGPAAQPDSGRADGTLSPPDSAGKRPRWLIPAAGFVALVVVAGAAALAGNALRSNMQNPNSVADEGVQPGVEGVESQGGTDDPRDGETRTSSGVTDSADFSLDGVWTGDGYSPSSGANYYVTLRLEEGQGSDVEGQVRVTAAESGRSGVWYVSGTKERDSIELQPGGWISQPNSEWVRDSFELTGRSDGSLDGTATAESPVGTTWTLTLDMVTEGEADADAVAEDWRVALVVPESDARGILEGMRRQHTSTRDGLTGSWVPQISSACAGLQTAQGPLTSSSILARHARASQELGAITVAWQDIGTTTPDACPSETMWIVLVPETFSDADGVIGWCSSKGLGRDDCAARYLAPRGTTGTQIEYQD